MSLKSVKTLTATELAKKWNLSLGEVLKLIDQGAAIEKEHTKSIKDAKEIARDHIGEKLDYYKRLKKVDEGISSGPERTSDYSIGDPGGGRTLMRPLDVKEGAKLNKVKKAAMAGMTAANLYTLGDVTSRAVEGNKTVSAKHDVVKAASALPGPAGYAASAVNYAKQAYDKVKHMKEEKNDLKDACWKGYTAKGLKKKGNRMVPNCVPVEESELNIQEGRPATRQKPEIITHNDKQIGKVWSHPDGSFSSVRKKGAFKVSLKHKTREGAIQHLKDKSSEMNEGYASIGRPYDWAGDVNSKAKFYGKKPKATTTKNDEKDDTYKGSKQGGKVKLVKTVKEAMVATAAQPVPASYQAAQQQQMKTVQPGQTKINIRDIAPRSQTSGTGTARLSQGGTSGGYNTLRPTTTDVKRNISNRFNPSFSQQSTGSLKPSSVSGSSSMATNSQSRAFSVGKTMGDKLDTVSRGMPKGFVPSTFAKAAPTAAKIAGSVARIAAGPAATAAASVLSPTPAGEKNSEFQRQADVAKGINYKAQGRSISQYEKDVLTPKASETPKAEPKMVNAPTPPSRPEYMSRGQAFGAARKEAGGSAGQFSYDNKSYQTNVAGEPYKPSSQLKQTSVREDWQSVNRKDKTDGLSQAAVNAYRRENPGSKLKTAVTEKNPTGKRAARRKSFCSRMGGMKKRLTSAKTARDPDSRINKALRRWNCEESVINELKAETLGSYIKKASESRKKALDTETGKADVKTWGKRQKGITTAIKKLTNEETIMDTKDHINEAIENILENNLSEMKENFMNVLQEKAIEKLEERKKEIAANYFAQ